MEWFTVEFSFYIVRSSYKESGRQTNRYILSCLSVFLNLFFSIFIRLLLAIQNNMDSFWYVVRVTNCNVFSLTTQWEAKILITFISCRFVNGDCEIMWPSVLLFIISTDFRLRSQFFISYFVSHHYNWFPWLLILYDVRMHLRPFYIHFYEISIKSSLF